MKQHFAHLEQIEMPFFMKECGRGQFRKVVKAISREYHEYYGTRAKWIFSYKKFVAQQKPERDDLNF